MSRLTRLVSTAAVASMLATGGVAGAGAASGAERSTVARSTVDAPVASASRRADIDGDGRPDRVALTVVGRTPTSERLSLSVRTAAGRSSSVRMSVPVTRGGFYSPADALQGTAEADGVRGREILVDMAGGDPSAPRTYRVYTWRDGALQEMPGIVDAGGWAWGRVPTSVDGYEVGTRRGVRTLVHRHLVRSRGTRGAAVRFAGTATTYVWTRSGWSRRAVAPVRDVTLAQAQAISGCHGITWI